MKFKLNQKLYSSLMAMLDDYTAIGVGSMELIDEGGKVIAYIDPNKHLSGVDLSGLDLSGLDLSTAYLIHANLRNADLSNANLSHANLRNSNLSHADLSHADLSNAYLSNADLRNADLRHADLSHADLSNAYLSYAYLRNADLRNAYLIHANLIHANLSHADLSNAQISMANMYGATLTGATIGELLSSLLIPRGKLIGFKKIVSETGEPFLAKIMVKAGTPRSKATTNKMRAKSVVVLGFYEMNGERSQRTIGYSLYNTSFCYRLGKVNCDKWVRNRWQECAGGIHFFLSWRDAVEYMER